MCNINQSITLCESRNSQLSWCKRCKAYSLIHNSCCASFQKDELLYFRSILEGLSEEDYHLERNGNEYVIIRNKNTAVGMCLTPEETQEIIHMINKAETLAEAFEIVYSPKTIQDE